MGDGNGEKTQEYHAISMDEDKKKVSNEHSKKWSEWCEVDLLLNEYFVNSNKILSTTDVKSLDAVRSESGGTVLDLTVGYGSSKHLTFLLGNDHFKSLVDTPNNDGMTPLHRAIENKKDWAVEALLQHNADPNARNKKGNSPLHHLNSCNLNPSWKCFITDIVKKQREYGTFLDIDALNNEKKTPRNELEIITGDQLLTSSTAGLGPHATKIKQRANIYNLLMENKYSNLLTKLETKQDGDFYVDNKKLICHILGRLKREEESKVPALKQIVEKLLELGVSPLSSDNRGRNSAVELALENKQRDLLKQMIYNLRTDKKYDISFDLLRRTFMMTAEVNDFQEREKETMYWLQFLFDNDAIKNINQINPWRRGTKETALHIAVNYSNERALVFLLKRGAALNEDNRKDVLHTLTPETLTEEMSHAISFEKTEDKKKVTGTAVLNYKFFNPHQKTGERTDESGGTIETDTVMSICKQYKDAIAHPLLWTLIMAKWSKLEKANTVYSVITILYNLALVIAFTALVWPISNHGTDPTKSTDERHVLIWTVIVLCLISFVVDVSKFVLSQWFCSLWPQRSIKIVLSLACYDIFIKFLIIIFCAGIFSTNFVAWVVPGAWLNFAITMGYNITCLNTITTMLWKITLHIGKLCLIALFLVIGFSVSFSVLIGADPDRNNVPTLPDFDSPLLSFPRVVAMATGEFGYDELRDGLLVDGRALASVSAELLFLVFVFLVFLVVMNVMTGVAMVEAQEIKASAAENHLKRQLEVAYLVERIPHKLLRYCKMFPRAQLFPLEPILKVDMKTGEISYRCRESDPPKPETDQTQSEESETDLSEPVSDQPELKAEPSKQVGIIHLDTKTTKVLKQKLTRLWKETKKQKEKEDRHLKLDKIYRTADSASNPIVSSQEMSSET